MLYDSSENVFLFSDNADYSYSDFDEDFFDMEHDWEFYHDPRNFDSDDDDRYIFADMGMEILELIHQSVTNHIDHIDF